MSSGDGGTAAQTQQGAAGGEAAEGAQAQGPDIGALAQSLEQLQGGQEELRQFLMSAPWQQAAEEVQEAEPELDLSFLMPQAELEGDDLAKQLSTALSSFSDERSQQQIQETVKPLQETLNDIRYRMDVGDLVTEFPEMADPEVAQQVAGPNGLAAQLAQQLGQPELAAKPQFWRLAYMAARAADAANEEGGESPTAAHLEGGGGAGPAGQQVDPADQIFGAPGGGRSVLPFG